MTKQSTQRLFHVSARPSRPIEPEVHLGMVHSVHVMGFVRRAYIGKEVGIFLAEVRPADTGPDENQLRIEAAALELFTTQGFHGTNIRDIRASLDNEGRGQLVLTAEIFDLKHLERITAALKGVKGVMDVERISGEPAAD